MGSLFALLLGAKAQTETPTKWRANISLGQYSAKIGTPNLKPFRLGINLGANYHLNKSEKHQLKQSFHLAMFRHKDLQTAVQLYSEFQYEWHFAKWSLTPLAIGGGYVASFSDMTTLKWDGKQYTKVGVALRNNFLISLGPNLGYESSLKAFDKQVTFTLGYRLQVQGVMIKEAVPVIAYSSLQLGAGFPF